MSKLAPSSDANPTGSWTQDPPSERCSHTVSYQTEIVSATGFDGRELFVRYEVVCPSQWDLRTGNTGDGVVSEDSGSEKSSSEFEEEQDLLSGTTQRASTIEKPFSAYCRTGFGSGVPLSTDIGMFQGGTEGSFWGTLYFVITCISVVVGYGYAFWVVPALVIPIVLGSGNPGGGDQEIIYLSEEDEMDEAWGGTYGTPQYSQAPRLGLSSSTSSVGGVAEPIATFNHQMSLSFDVKELPYDSAVAPSGTYPVLLVEVFSVGMFGSNSLEGYGYLPMKSTPGAMDASIMTWRPIGSRVARMNDAFVGSAPELRNSIFAEVPNKVSSSLSRFGVLSEGSGSLRIRINTAVTDPRVDETVVALRAKDGHSGAGGRRDSSRRTVDDILQQMKVAGALSRTAGGHPPAAVASSRGSSAASAPHVLDREARVLDILRRAKTRLGEHATQRNADAKDVTEQRKSQPSRDQSAAASSEWERSGPGDSASASAPKDKVPFRAERQEDEGGDDANTPLLLDTAGGERK